MRGQKIRGPAAAIATGWGLARSELPYPGAESTFDVVQMER